ncbi:MAG: PIN domain nuclease [Chloroflexi bacterium]|nr:MAG: PIN domain nuclease [Chloroflexota bacterium]
MALTGVTHMVDKSALARLKHAAVAAILAPMLASGRVASSGVLALEVLYSARSYADFVKTRRRLAGFPSVAILEVDFARSIDVLQQLCRRGQHRSARLPDLLLAAAAERSELIVLHYDSDFDLITAITKQPTQWVVPRGSVP